MASNVGATAPRRVVVAVERAANAPACTVLSIGEGERRRRGKRRPDRKCDDDPREENSTPHGKEATGSIYEMRSRGRVRWVS